MNIFPQEGSAVVELISYIFSFSSSFTYLWNFMPFGICSRFMDEYGRVVLPSKYLKTVYDNWGKHWCRNLTYGGGTAIEGNPADPGNDGIEGLAWHHCLGSMMNHAVRTRPNVAFVKVQLPYQASPNLLFPNGHNSNEVILIMTLRNCYPHEQALIDYDEHASTFYTIRFS